MSSLTSATLVKTERQALATEVKHRSAASNLPACKCSDRSGARRTCLHTQHTHRPTLQPHALGLGPQLERDEGERERARTPPSCAELLQQVGAAEADEAERADGGMEAACTVAALLQHCCSSSHAAVYDMGA